MVVYTKKVTNGRAVIGNLSEYEIPQNTQSRSRFEGFERLVSLINERDDGLCTNGDSISLDLPPFCSDYNQTNLTQKEYFLYRLLLLQGTTKLLLNKQNLFK